MSCSPPIPRLGQSDSSDYGSDFTPEEDELLNELLAQAVAGNATARLNATSTSTSTTTSISTPIPIAAPENRETDASVIPSAADIESLQPTAVPALVTDIEDGIEDLPGVRQPKVLGRERPRSPWRRSGQPYWLGSQATRKSMDRSSPAPNNRSSPIGRRSPDMGTLLQLFEPRLTLHYPKRLVEHPHSTEGRERERERMSVRESAWTQEAQATATLDTRSPVERFRRPPNKAFSVTDLVSPAWCELQYWYTLTKHGRKRRTPAMKKGSVVHKTLEDEIYTTVPVEITTKEDAWALRIWNVIQGLRILREYGITRELEVWGIIDGEVVNGVIDQLSYECPDSELEATAARFYDDAVTSRTALPEYQMSLSDYLLSSSQGGRRLSDLADLDDLDGSRPIEEGSTADYNLPRIYMTDVKTKANGSAPTVKSTSFRPTLLQLQLYYHMLNRLATSDDVTIYALAERYDFDPERPFTDAFINEVGGLNDEFFDAESSQELDLDDLPNPNDPIPRSSHSASDSSPPKASQDSTSVLSSHRNLSLLWDYMKDQLRLTFIPDLSQTSTPVAPSIPSHTQPDMLKEYPTLLSPVLTARYVSSAPTTDLHPRHIGSRSFFYDTDTMSSYIAEQMEWWRGQRDPRGVNVVEAWKCRYCEFSDECTWRQERALEYARRNSRRRTSASVDI